MDAIAAEREAMQRELEQLEEEERLEAERLKQAAQAAKQTGAGMSTTFLPRALN